MHVVGGCLQAVGGWRQRQAVAQLRTGSSWLAVETGRHNGSERAERVCQRCSSSATDDVEHMVFADCSALFKFGVAAMEPSESVHSGVEVLD